MAITNVDGSIILSTKIDTKGLEAAMAKMRQQAKGTGSAFESLSNFIKIQETRLAALRQQYASYVLKNEQSSVAAKKLAADIKNLSASLAQNQRRLSAAAASAVSFGAKAKTAIAGVGASLKILASYLIGIQTIFAVFRFSGEGAKFATQTEASVQRLVDIYGEASQSVGDFIDTNARALGMSKAAAASFSSVYGNLFSVWADQATNAELTNRYLNMTAVVASKTSRTIEDVQERVRSGLLGNTEAIEDLGIFVNVKTIEMTDAFKRMANGKSWEQLDAYTQQQIRSMAILEQATAKYGDEVADTSATIRNRFNAAYQDFKNSWGNIVNTVLLPVLETLTQIFDIATKGLNALSGRSGQILENVELQEESTNKTAENIEQQVENQKELNKELKKSLAGFDDIQILSAGTAETTQPPPDVDNITGGGGTAPNGSVFEETSQKIQDLAKVVAKAMIAIGCVLLATGHIGWGIGLIIAGAMAEGIVEASVGDGSSFQKIADTISNAIIIAGVIAIILGILLCMAQQWGLGVGLIIKGAILVGGSVALNWDSIKEKLQGSFGGWLVLGGAIAIILGILLCFTSFLPLGIGLIVLGLGATIPTVVVNWDTISKKIRRVFNTIANWVESHGFAMLVLGCILCASGIFLPVGIALIAFGAKGMVQEKDPLWNTIKSKISKVFYEVIDWVTKYGGLVLGILLLFTGVGGPLGMALIMDAVSAMGKGEKPVLWDSILESIKTTWENIKTYWNENIAYVWTLEFWLGLAKIAGNGLIEGFEASINAIIGMYEKMLNFIIKGLNKISFEVPDWVLGIGGKKFGFDIKEVKFDRAKIPRLAKGTVVPPNKEFMAVLGDNKREHEIVSPVSTMKQAFMEAMIEMGGNFGGGNTEVVLEIDGREFGRAVVEQSDKENRRIGTKLVVL